MIPIPVSDAIRKCLEKRRLFNPPPHPSIHSVAGDYFVVRISEDPVYGTPIFTTMGGESKCPGETGTLRRESGVEILQVLPNCGPDSNSECTGANTAAAGVASFSVIILNNSPTGSKKRIFYDFARILHIFRRPHNRDHDLMCIFRPTYRIGDVVDYTLTWASDGDYLDESFATLTCPSPGNAVPGRLYDLVAVTTGTVNLDTPLRAIAFQKFYSRLITIANGAVCTGPYRPKLRITATCEMSAVSAEVYQYGIVMNTTTRLPVISYDPADRLYASSDTKEIYLDFTPVVTGGSPKAQSVDGKVSDERKSDMFVLIAAVFAVVVTLFAALIKIYFILQRLEKAAVSPVLLEPQASPSSKSSKGRPKRVVEQDQGVELENIYVQAPDSDLQMHHASPTTPTNDTKV